MAGYGILTRPELDRYCELIPDNEDLKDEWEAAIDDPKKYVTLLVGQRMMMSSGPNWMKRTITTHLRRNRPSRIIFSHIMR